MFPTGKPPLAEKIRPFFAKHMLSIRDISADGRWPFSAEQHDFFPDTSFLIIKIQ